MSSLGKPSRRRRRPRYESANDWPSTPAVDGFVWAIGPDAEPPTIEEPTGPTGEDAKWAAQELDDEWFDHVADEALELMAAESEEIDRMSRGLRFY